MRSCDALVIGGGPAGAMAALLLARAGRSVVVLEKSRFPRGKVCGEFIAASGIGLLQSLHLSEIFHSEAGPEIRRIALWAGNAAFEAPMPAFRREAPYPRALARETLDALLLERAAQCGAQVLQPATALAIERTPAGLVCRAAQRRGAPELEIEARALIGAHGSWEPGGLPTQAPRLTPNGADLFGFKAHFVGGDVPPNTIALIPFAGGYAGLVERGAGRATFACCVRHDAFASLRSALPGVRVGESIFKYLLSESRALRHALGSAAREGAWLAAGPLRPGTRPLYNEGIFAIGNAAGEAHPVVGEGIANAMHSAALLCGPLNAALQSGFFSAENQLRVADAYRRAWRRNFVFRLWASARLAGLAMRPGAAKRAQTLLGFAPGLLTLAARMSGKTRQIGPNLARL